MQEDAVVERRQAVAPGLDVGGEAGVAGHAGLGLFTLTARQHTQGVLRSQRFDLAAQVIRGRTHISWVWDVYDGERLRALRITGEEAAGRAGGDPWSVADTPMLRKIARASMDRLAAYLGNPGAPLEPDASIAIAASPEPETPPQPRRRAPRSAAAPTAAEQLALSAAR